MAMTYIYIYCIKEEHLHICMYMNMLVYCHPYCDIDCLNCIGTYGMGEHMLHELDLL